MVATVEKTTLETGEIGWREDLSFLQFQMALVR